MTKRINLINGITELSTTKNLIDISLSEDKQYEQKKQLWKQTCAEWCIVYIEDVKKNINNININECICTQHINIKCYISNVINFNNAIVGNKCISQFSNEKVINEHKIIKKDFDKLKILFDTKNAIKLKVKYLSKTKNIYKYQILNNEIMNKIKEECDIKKYKYTFIFDKDIYYITSNKKINKTLINVQKIHINLKTSFN